VGYAIAGRDVAHELSRRQGPAPVSTLSVALALAGLAQGPPDVAPIVEERERLTGELQRLALRPLASQANFVALPLPDGAAFADRRLDVLAADGACADAEVDEHLGAHVLADVDDRREAAVLGNVARERRVLEILRPDAQDDPLALESRQRRPCGDDRFGDPQP